MNIRILQIIAIILIALPCNIIAKDKKNDKKDSSEAVEVSSNLRQWAQAQALPEERDGVKIFRPMENDKGQAEISDMIDFPGLSAEKIFVAALIYFSENIDRETEEIESVDFDNHRFIVRRKIEDQESNPKMTYNYLGAYQCSDGLMMFVDYDIVIDYKERGLIGRHLEIEKFKPQSNKNHAAMIEAFSFAISKKIRSLSDFISHNSLDEVTHWPEIKDHKVVKGMNPTEVRLIGGRPVSIRENGDKTKWMFSNEFVVVFTDGKVTSIVQ